MNTDAIKTALARIAQDADTGHPVLDKTVKNEIQIVTKRLEREFGEYENLERRAAGDLIQTADPTTRVWMDAVWRYWGSAAEIGDACDRSKRTVEGWYAGRAVPLSAITALRKKSKPRA